MKLRGAIFDMDGTLLDSMPMWVHAGARYLLSRGVPPGPDLDQRYLTMTLLQSAEDMIRRYGFSESPEEIREGVLRSVAQFYQEEALPRPGVPALLCALSRHHIPMCVATATDRPMVEDALRRNGLMDYFDGIFTCSEVGSRKTAPDIYECALARCGTGKAETFVFEDAYYAALTAKNAGFPLVGVFDPTEKRPEELRAIADISIRSMEDMLPLLPELL